MGSVIDYALSGKPLEIYHLSLIYGKADSWTYDMSKIQKRSANKI